MKQDKEQRLSKYRFPDLLEALSQFGAIPLDIVFNIVGSWLSEEHALLDKPPVEPRRIQDRFDAIKSALSIRRQRPNNYE